MENVSTMVMDRTNWPSLDKTFKLAMIVLQNLFIIPSFLCSINPPLSSPEDVSILASALSGTFAGVVQYNNDAGKVVYN